MTASASTIPLLPTAMAATPVLETALQLETPKSKGKKNQKSPAVNTPDNFPIDEYTFVPVTGESKNKRARRRPNEIDRLYKCGFKNCEKAYGWLNHLNTHVAWHDHGPKRLPSGQLSSLPVPSNCLFNRYARLSYLAQHGKIKRAGFLLVSQR